MNGKKFFKVSLALALAIVLAIVSSCTGEKKAKPTVPEIPRAAVKMSAQDVPVGSDTGGFTISIVNQLTKYPDDKVYWGITALNQEGENCYMTQHGTLKKMSVNDNINVVPGPPNCNGTDKFADYFFNLKEVPKITIAKDAFIDSARIRISLGSWLPICVHQKGFAPPSITNKTYQGYSTIFQFEEFAYNVSGKNKLFINTSSVEFVGFPTPMTFTDATGTYNVGYNTSRSDIINAFENCPDEKFKWLVIPGMNTKDLRIISPMYAGNCTGPVAQQIGIPPDAINYFENFYTEYIDDCWTYYKNKSVTFRIDKVTYTGQVQDGIFKFYPGTSVGGTPVLELTKPSSCEIMQCIGVFKHGNATQQTIQKFVAAAMLRTVFMETPTNSDNSWCSPAMIKKYYTNKPINYYAKMLHENSTNNLCYAFPYDDVCNQSTSLSSDTTKSVVFTLTEW